MESERRFYVYVHRRKTDDKIFYVGKGSGRRSGKHQGRSEYWKRVVNKHGFYHEKIFFTDSENCAFTMEKIKIFLLNKKGFKITNLSSGGEGAAGVVKSAETCKKISINRKGKGILKGKENPCTIETSRTWWNISGEIFKGSHADLHVHTGIPMKYLKAVETGRKYSYKGWKVVGVNNYPSNGKSLRNINASQKNYNFYKDDYPNFIGTSAELCNFYPLDSCKMRSVCRGIIPHYKGWRCSEL